MYANLITLQTGAKDEWTLYPADKKQTAPTQSISATSSGNCTIKTPTGSIADLGGSKKAGIRSGSIGIADKTSGESCAQVTASPSETLTIDLKGRTADLAVLDVELQKDAVILATATLAGGDASYFEVQSGDSITGGAALGGQSSAIVAECQVGTSSGPNSGSSDNCRWVIQGALFDKLELKAVRGLFSLEGGADGAAATSSGDEPSGLPATLTYFRIASLFECQTGSVTVDGLGTTPTVTIRDVDVSSGTECTDFAYSLSTGVVEGRATATFTKPWSEQSERLQFMMDLQWAIAPGEVAALPPVEFGFHDKDLNPGEARELGWCANSTFELSNGGQPAITDDMDVEPWTGDPSLDPFPGVQYACMIPNPSVIPDGEGLAWLQSIYVHGDAYARR